MAECNREQESNGPARKKLKLSISKKDRASWHEVLKTGEPQNSLKASEKTEESDTNQPPASTEKREAYYSANFKAILKNVLSSSPEKHVIDDESARIAEKFTQLPEPQQQLYVRLFLRKRQWIRATKLSYKDIADGLSPLIEGLVSEGFLLNEKQLADPSEVLNLLQLSELKTVCKQLRLPTSLVGNQKPKIIEALFKHDRQHQPLFGTSQFLKTVVNKAKVILGKCVRVAESPGEVFSKLMLLFSLTSTWLNGDDDNSFSQIIFRMLQVNIGRLVYPKYDVNVTQSLFSSTEEFESYYLATKESQSLTQAVEEGDNGAFGRVVKRAREMLERDLQLRAESSCSHNKALHSNNTSPPLSSSSLPPYLLPFTTGWTYTRLLSNAVEHLDKKGKHDEANAILELLLSQDVYRRGSRGKWWDRLTLNYDYHLKMKEKCLDAIKRGLDDPYVRDARRLLLIQRARRLCQSLANSSSKKQKKGRKNGATKRGSESESTVESSSCTFEYDISDFPDMDLIPAPEVIISGKQMHSDSKSVFLAPISTDDSDQPTPSTPSPWQQGNSHALVGVEAYAIYHYHQEKGWPCALHAEASTFTAMCSLLMWNVIFAPGVPDVFRTPYQGGPLDLLSDYFYKNRKVLVDERLKWIREASVDEIGSAVQSTWDDHCDCVCIGMNWELFPSMEDAKSLAMCMGGELLSHVCEIFSKDFSRSCGGLPDLTLWNPATKQCKFVEVKGPGDRLSTKQMVWLSRLAEWKCDVEVCRVRAAGST